MKRRLALKVCRGQFGPAPWETMRLRRGGMVRRAIVASRRWEHDDRFPFVPDDDELNQQGEVLLWLFRSVLEEA